MSWRTSAELSSDLAQTRCVQVRVAEVLDSANSRPGRHRCRGGKISVGPRPSKVPAEGAAGVH